jgi:PAS domain S-box-containing protein
VDKYFDVNVCSPRRGQFAVTFIDITERKRTEEALATSEKHYREFFERNLAGTFRATLDGKILECNASFTRMLGYASQEEILSHSSWDLYVQPSDREVAINRLLDLKTLTNEEYCLRRKDGSLVWVLANRTLNEAEQPPVVEGTMMDITAQKRAEADIRSLLNLSKTLNSLRDAEVLMDSLIVEAVKLTDAELGWSGIRTPEGMVCKRVFRDGRFIPFEYCWSPGVGWPGWVLTHKVPYVTNDALGDRIIVPAIREQFGVRSGLDTPLRDVRGEVIGFFEVNNKRDTSGFTESDVEKMIAVSQIASVALQNTMSFQKIQQNEEELCQLSARLLRLQEEERRRLARDLHDSTGQVLAALILKIRAARQSVGVDSEKTIGALTECSALAKQCSNELRTLSYVLHPPSLDQESLASALRWYAQGFSKRSGIQVELDLPSELDPLPGEVEKTLFRIVQEGLTNIHLHSGSPTAWIKIAIAPSQVALEIRDEGKGLPSEVLKRVLSGIAELGVGIAGMRERVRQLGGWLEIDSGKAGTCVRAVLPLSGSLSS